MDLTTERLILHPITVAEAARIIAREPDERDDWHPEYPLADELDVLRGLSAAEPEATDPDFRPYMIRRRSDGLAVGGIGFLGAPGVDGEVEVGYGLVPAARGSGFATEALGAAVRLAFARGASAVVADTADDNIASRRVLEKSGFRAELRRDGSVGYRIAASDATQRGLIAVERREEGGGCRGIRPLTRGPHRAQCHLRVQVDALRLLDQRDARQRDQRGDGDVDADGP